VVVKSHSLKLEHLDLCSGIGGFALGLQNTGHFKTIAFCEIEPFCQKVLKQKFPDTKIYNDIKELKPNDERLKPDIITAGFPCQPFSTAGKRKGAADNRNLWKETIRIIKESRPTWFIGENVPGIISLYLDTVLKDLEEADYSTRTFNIPANSVGANHQRKRMWIIGHANGDSEGNEFSNTNGWEQTHEPGSTLREKGNEKPHVMHFDNGDVSDTWKGEDTWWTHESKLFGVPHGVSTELDQTRNKRIKALGNAILPLIPYYLGKAILQTYTL